MTAYSKSGMRRQCAPRPGSRWQRALRLGTRQRCALGPGSRMTSGGGTTVSRVTEE
jgi:hypothetical protein